MKASSLELMVRQAKEALSMIPERLHPMDADNGLSLVNTHLTLHCIQQGFNSYLGLNSENILEDQYMPLILMLVHILMIQNIGEYKPTLKSIGKDQILIQNGVCKKIVRDGGVYKLKSSVKNGFRYQIVRDVKKVLASHFITDEKFYSDRVSHKNLGEYESFARETYGLDKCPPSLFSHRAAVVGKVKTITEQLWKHNLQRAFPHALVSRDDGGLRGESLPLEPMIIFSSSYEGLSRYLNSTKSHVDHLIVLGDSRISNNLSQIRQDNERGLVKGYHLLGNAALQGDSDMKVWNWTRREEQYLLGAHSPVLNHHEVPVDEKLSGAFSEFYSLVAELGEEFGGYWYFRTIIQSFRNILADKLNIEGDFETAYGERIRNDADSGTLSLLIPQGGDIDMVLQEVLPVLKTIHSEKSRGVDYLDEAVAGFGDSLTFVVPRSLVESWRDMLEQREMREADVVSYGELTSALRSGLHRDEYVFTHPPNQRHLEQLSRISLGKPVAINLFLYDQELEHVSAILRRCEIEARLTGGHKDGEIFPDIDIEDVESVRREGTADLISRLEETHALQDGYDTYEDVGDYGYASVRIIVLDEEGERMELNCPSHIIRQTEEIRQMVDVAELTPGDELMLYSNKNSELLYEIISEDFESFTKTKDDSLLWKTRLRSHVNYTGEDSEHDEAALGALAQKLGLNQRYMMDNWIKNLDRVRFPRRKTLKVLIEHLIETGCMSETEGLGVFNSRSLYSSVMISLGQNLSGEIHSIVLNSTESSMEEYISTSVSGNQNEYPILSDFEPALVLSIVRANLEPREFVSLVSGE